MKKIKHFLTAMAVMFTMGVNAQTWTGNEVAAGTFYLYNVGAQKFINNGDPLQNWGTNAYLQAGFGLDIALAEVSAGVYTMDTNVSNGGNQHYLGSNTWTDADATNWTFRAVEGETYTYQIIFDGQYLMANEGLDDVEMVGDPGSRVTSTYWKLVTENDFKAAMQAKTYSATNPMDVSIFIKGRSFGRNDKRNDLWVTTHDGGNWVWMGQANGSSGHPKYFGNEAWNNTFDVHQDITGLPDGTYEVQCSGFGTNGTTYVYGNTTKGQLQTDNSTSYGDSKEAKWEAIHEDNAFAGQSSGTFTLSGGNLTVGVKRDTNNGGDWAIWDEFRLYYYGLDLSEFAATLAAAVTAAEAVGGTVPTAVYETLAAVVTEQNKTYTTAAEYQAAANAIEEATNTAKAFQANYGRYTSIKAAALAIAPNTATTAADTEVEAATTDAAIDAAVATLRAAFLVELPNVTIPTGGCIDVTGVMLDNASVRHNTDYWTIANLTDPGWNSSAGVCSYEECEFYSRNFKFYQTLAMNVGTWEFGVTGFHRAGNHSTYFYAGEDKILVPGVESSEVNSMAQAKDYFDAGNGKLSLKFIIETAQNVEIGINNQDTETDKWTIFRDFTLKYYGPVDYSVYKDEWRDAVIQADAAMITYANVTGQELTNLNAALANEPTETSLKADYVAKIQALQEAIVAFIAAAPNYDLYASEKAIAQAISETITTPDPTSADDAMVQFRALKVAEYNYVLTAYPFSATSKIGEFSTWDRTGTVNGAEKNEFEALTSQHWSGTEMTYYEQPADGWNQNAWTANYTKTCTLPAGDYIIKVAARAASGHNTVAKITCSAATMDGPIPNFGDTGKGITIEGVASFDEGEFCNGGAGRGWVWNYLPFSLDAETEVTMTVVAQANSNHQWFSVCDGELLSTTNIATPVAYNDASANTITNVDVANVTISREIKVGYNTVVLPFDLTAQQVVETFGSGSEVYAFSENSTNPDDVIVNFTKVTEGTITANIPVIVKATAASSEQVFKGVEVKAAEEAKVEGNFFDFVGIYAPLTIPAGDYFISGDALYKSAGATSINAFRAYLKNKAAEEVSIKVFIGDFETAIDAINASTESGIIYNLAGQRLNKVQKGINIVNGKKVLY